MVENRFLRALELIFSRGFGFLVLLFAVAGVVLPDAFAWGMGRVPIPGYPMPVINVLLATVMLGMGLTIRWEDLAHLAVNPRQIILGLLAQYSIMAGLAWCLVKALGLPIDLAIGVVLVGCCPGGTASNVIAWMARGDVAYSVSLTIASTLAAPLLTPFLVAQLIGARLEVDVVPMMRSMGEIVLLPVVTGYLLRQLLRGRLEHVLAVLPAISAVAIGLIVAIVIAGQRGRLGEVTGVLAAAVVLHNLVGLLLGYALAKVYGLEEALRRTLAIEVGMQNSGLAVSLARTHFDGLAGATLPGALFSVWHNLSGSILAAIWRWRDGE